MKNKQYMFDQENGDETNINEQYVSPGRWECLQVELMYSHAKTC